jgi:hypothetical protein
VPAAFASVVADTRINFCLATRDPGGNITTGITRRSTTVTGFDANTVKSASSGGTNSWNTTEYLNIWCCRLTNGVNGFGVFPGQGPIGYSGVVMDYRAFGRGHAALDARYSLARLAVHEVGHWLNLEHIFGSGGSCTAPSTDYVNDTPPQPFPNQGNPTFPHVTCPSIAPDGDMFMNQMDYVDDDSKLMFTADQALRLQATIATGGYRASLKNSPAFTPVLTIGYVGTPLTDVDCGDQTPFRLRANPGTVGCGGGTLQYQWTAANGWTVTNPTLYSPTITPNGSSGSTITLTGTYTNVSGVVFPLNTVSMTIGFNPALATPVFASNTPVSICPSPGGSYQFPVTPVAGASSYRWTVPAGFTPSGQFTTVAPNQYSTTTSYIALAVSASVVGDVYSLACQALGTGCNPSAVASWPFIANGGPDMKIVDVDASQNNGDVVCQRNRLTLELVPVTPTPPGVTWANYTNILWSIGAQNQATNPVQGFPLRATYHTPDLPNTTFMVTATYKVCGITRSAFPYSAKTASAGNTSLSNGYNCIPNRWRPAPAAPYPNPATGRLQLPDYQGTVVVYNQLGKPMHQLLAPGTGPDATVDTSTWPEGLYVVTGRNILGEFLRHNVQVQH